jgi:hypothetical protein
MSRDPTSPSHYTNATIPFSPKLFIRMTFSSLPKPAGLELHLQPLAGANICSSAALANPHQLLQKLYKSFPDLYVHIPSYITPVSGSSRRDSLQISSNLTRNVKLVYNSM